MKIENILAIDTATKHLRLALQFGEDRTVKSDEKVFNSHSQMLARKIDNILQSGGLAKKDIGSIIINRGPGSFTGLRIGLATAQGMSVAMDIPVFAVSMFDIAAFLIGENGGETMVLAPFKRDACVMSVVDGGRWKTKELQVIDISEGSIVKSPGENPLVAIGYDIDNDILSSSPDNPIRVLQYDAADVLAVGQSMKSSDSDGRNAVIEPLYAQPSQAEINLRRHDQIG